MKLTWITIVTTKFEESKEFYRDFLGMEPGAAFSPNEFMDIAFFKDQNGMQVELIWSKKKTEAKRQRPYLHRDFLRRLQQTVRRSKKERNHQVRACSAGSYKHVLRRQRS